MAIPAQFRKNAPSPGDRAAGRSAPPAAKEDSPQEALHILEGAIHSTQGKAALKTIETELSGGGKTASPGSTQSSSPGSRAASKFMPKK